MTQDVAKMGHDRGASVSLRQAMPAVPFARRVLAAITLERVSWLILFTCVVGIAIVPLFYVFDAATLRETRVGLSNERSFVALLDVYTSSGYLAYLRNTLVLAAGVTFLSVVVGVSLAVLIARTDVGYKSTLDLLIIMPLFMSPFTGLMAWIALGSEKSGFINVLIKTILSPLLNSVPPVINIWSYAGIVWVMVLFFCPFAYLFTVSSLRGMDSSLEESARSTGATPLQTLWHVTLPMSVPAIMGAALLIFILGAEMYTIPGMIGSNVGFTTLPWKIYQDINGVPVKLAHAAASGTLLLWITCLGLLLQRRMTRRTEKFATMTGKGFHSRPLPLGRWKFPALAFIGAYIFAADLLPFGGLLLSSMMKYSAPSITTDIFTIKNFTEFFMLQNMIGALRNTIILAILSASICAMAGFLISYMELRRVGVSTKLLAFIGVLPVAVPGVVYGIGLLWTFLRTPFYGSIWVLLFAYIAKFLPYSIVVSRSAIIQIHPDLEHSARMCGANGFRALRHITMPLLKPALIAILFFVMLMSIKELSASVLLYTQRSQVLSVLTWHYMDAGNYQFAAAIGVVQTLIMISLIFITRRIFRIQLEKTISKSGT